MTPASWRRLPFRAALAVLALLSACGDPSGSGGGDDLSRGVGSGPERLLSDAEMRTPEDPAAPPENAAWAAWAERNHQPVRSLTSGNFADLQFLKPLLAGKRIVQLGESSHGVAEYSEAKTRLIRFLHQEMGFEVIAFESGLQECWTANRALEAGGDAAAALRYCLYGVWQVQEAVPLFAYARSTHGSDRPLRVAGFDVQPSGRGAAQRGWFFRELVGTIDGAYADSVLRMDTVLAARMTLPTPQRLAYLAENGERLRAAYLDLAAFLDRNRDAITRAFPARPGQAAVGVQAARGVEVWIRQMGAPSVDAAIPIRDRGMADHLEFLLQELFPGKKVIVWAHNFHIAHGTHEAPAIRGSMGSWVAERHRAELYTIALYAYRGRMRSNAGMVYDIFPTPPGSLESVLYRARRKHLFVDLAGAARSGGSEWMFVPVIARSSGANEERMVPRDQYDGVLFIDHVRPPSAIGAAAAAAAAAGEPGHP